MNEALNNIIARYAPKNRIYGTTMSLTYRIFMVVGIHNLGHYRFWREVFNLLGLGDPQGHQHVHFDIFCTI